MKKIWYKYKQQLRLWMNGQTWGEIIDQGFGRLAILKRTGEEKAEISINITETLKQKKLYWIEIILSSLIATFGLLQGSVAVIIGAMLIAPLMQPIQGMAFAISTGRQKAFWRSAKVLAGSIVISIFLSYLVCLIAPFKTENSEIIARTAPNLFDLFIAILSAIVAFMAIGYKKLSESVAGVAMAASLMPPLAVVGIEICFGSLSKSWGSFLLFFTNLVAILLVGTIMFIMYGFNPHEEQSTKTVKRLGMIIVIIIILWLPLMSGLTRISEKRDIELYSKETLSHTLSKVIPEAQIQRLNIVDYTEDAIHISGEIKLPENVQLFTEIIDEINQQMSEKIGKEVQLEIDIIRTASVIAKQSDPIPQPKEILKKATREILLAQAPNTIILTLETLDISTEFLPDRWSIKTVYALPSGEFMEESTRTNIESTLVNQFPGKKLKFLWFPVSQRTISKPSTEVHKPSPEEITQTKLEQKWSQFLVDQATDEINFENLKITWSEEEVEKEAPTEPDTNQTASIIENTREQELKAPSEKVLEKNNTTIMKIIIKFDLYTLEGANLEKFRQELEAQKQIALPDEVNIRYRVFEYNN